MNNKRLVIHTSLAVFLVLALSSNGALLVGEASTIQQPPAVSEQKTAELSGIQSTLWSQTDTTGGIGVSSSYKSPLDHHQIADDFVITDTVHNYWLVNAVQVVGYYSPDPGYTQAASVNLRFYTDTITNTKHIPGTLVYNSVVNTPVVSGTATINLSSPALLAVGTPITYWVSIQANMVSGTWLWTERNSSSPYNGTSPSAYLGEGAGFNSNCIVNWGRRVADCDFPPGSINVDMRFAILGQAVTWTNFIYLPSVRR